MTANHRRALRAYFTFRLVAPFVYTMWLTEATLYFASVVTNDPFRLAPVARIFHSRRFKSAALL